MQKGKQLNIGMNRKIIKHQTQAALPISSSITVVTLLLHEGQVTIVGDSMPFACEGYFLFSFYYLTCLLWMSLLSYKTLVSEIIGLTGIEAI